jgi:hypothetical protein
MKTTTWVIAAVGIALLVVVWMLRYDFVAVQGSVLSGYRLDRWTGEVVSFIGSMGHNTATECPQIDPSQIVRD